MKGAAVPWLSCRAIWIRQLKSESLRHASSETAFCLAGGGHQGLGAMTPSQAPSQHPLHRRSLGKSVLWSPCSPGGRAKGGEAALRDGVSSLGSQSQSVHVLRKRHVSLACRFSSKWATGLGLLLTAPSCCLALRLLPHTSALI